MSYHCSVLVVLRHFVKWRSLVVGITASSSSVGMFVVTQITEALLSNYGFKNALRGWAILFFLAIPLAYSYDSKSDVTEGTIKRNDDGSEQGFEATHSPSLSRNGHFIVYLFSVTLVFFAVPTLSIFLVRCELNFIVIQSILTLNTRLWNSHLELIPFPQYDGFTGNSRRKRICFNKNINSPFFRINLTIFPPSHYTPAYVVICLKNRVFSLTWPASMQIYWNKRKRLHKKRVQFPQGWLGTPTWPPFHCLGTPIWPPWRHVKTLYTPYIL